MSDSPSPVAGSSFAEPLGSGVSLEMVHIPEGIFLMGSPESEEGRRESEGPQHRVRVPSFCIGKYPVTQVQWWLVAQLPKAGRELESEPSAFEGDNLPVESVSWDDAVEFCKRLSVQTGKDYRLPSEAEWEYACKAGTTTPYYFGKTLNFDQANFEEAYGQTTPVNKFPANAYGLHDMHGNVSEWCQDIWHDNYEGAPSDGSAWEIDDDPKISSVVRGGSWFDHPRHCRSASRCWFPRVSYIVDRFGFRVCCSAPSAVR